MKLGDDEKNNIPLKSESCFPAKSTMVLYGYDVVLFATVRFFIFYMYESELKILAHGINVLI